MVSCPCLQAQNDEFAAIFNLEDYKVSRDKSYKQIAAAISKFREIKENINEGLKFYVTLQAFVYYQHIYITWDGSVNNLFCFYKQDAITNIKQQCSDFVMTRNIQCREMIEDVQRKVAGLSFQDGKSNGGYNSSYSSVGPPHQTQRTTSQQLTDPQSSLHPSRPQTPYYQPPEQPTVAGYSHAQPPYASPQQPPSPYYVPAAGGPYPPQQHPSVSHEYGQPAYPGWRGPYYNHAQQTGSHPPPPYTIPAPYPPNQGGYYKHQ
ncbi:hypothetical protein HHK36_014912 [Tetracentron sinense]|uniref:ALIX V-shaped domain-containing protein n=1 Tax=Tetracentron sinense TaxID=13715 RepID=A0A835DDC7_TETSI|nr:hypothetical protein HHK36_014912 [Tetracentron sinense]